MAFEVSYIAGHSTALLKHVGDVDVAEIEQSRQVLAACANEHGAAGVVIDILDAEITAGPADIIPNVSALCTDLRPHVRLGFVALKAQQETVSLIVSAVAFNSGSAVAEFHDRDAALAWTGALAGSQSASRG